LNNTQPTSTKELLYKPTIFKRGLVLVLAPLVVGSCILLFVNSLWHAVENKTLEQRQQTEIVDRLNNIFRHWAVVSGNLFASRVQQSDSFNQAADDNTIKLLQELDELNASSRSLSQKTFSPGVLRDLFIAETKAWNELPAATSGPENVGLETLQKIPSTLAKIYQLKTETKRVLSDALAEAKSLQEQQLKSRDLMKSAAYTATIFNFLVCFLLAWLFARPIGTRMSKLTHNANLLTTGSPLDEPLKGDDEFAFIDSTLHQSSERLQAAADHRQTILSMVTHDMRSPLAAAKANLQIMEESDEDYPDEAIDELQYAYKALEKIVQDMQSLLTVLRDEALSLRAVVISPSSHYKSTIDSIGHANGENLSAEISQPAQTSRLNFRPKIFHLSLILAVVPLLFQTMSLLIINQQLITSEKVTNGEQLLRNIVVQSNIAQLDLVRGAIAQALSLITHSSQAHSLTRQAFDEVRIDCDSLTKFASEAEQGRAYAEAFTRETNQTIGKLESLRSGAELANLEVYAQVGEVKGRSADAVHTRRLGKILFEENAMQLQSMEDRQRGLAKSIGQIIGATIFTNFVIALLLLLLFSRLTTKRLNTLIVQATSLGKRKEWHSELSGTDEIANLSQVLYEAAGQLRRAAEQRSKIMQSLATELRRPLIQALIHLNKFSALSESVLSSGSKKNLQKSNYNIERVLNLLNDLLNLERFETGKVDLIMRKCGALEIVDEAIATVSGLAAVKKIELKNLCAPHTVNADRARLVQVLVNYIGNSIKFSPEDKTIVVTNALNQGFMRFNVTDEGPGIAAETSDKLFDKFVQEPGEQQAQGFGLGLAICKLIVESHGGRLGAGPRLDEQGSIFWFDIPF
jgi:signal transduction histidine kinase